MSTPSAAFEALSTKPMPIDKVAEHPALSQVTISREGKYVAALMRAPEEKWPVVVVFDLDNLTKPPVGIPSTKMRPVSVQFVGEKNILILADQPMTRGACKNYARRWFIAPIDGSRPVEEFLPADTEPGVSGNCGIAEGVSYDILQRGNLKDRNRWLLARQTSSSEEIVALDVSKITSNEPKLERVARVGDRVGFLLADIRDGELMVREGARSTEKGWEVYREIRNRQSGAWEEHPDLGYLAKNRFTLRPLGFLETDPNKLLVASNAPVGGRTQPSDYTSVRVYDVVKRTWDPEDAYAAPKANVSVNDVVTDASETNILGPGQLIASGAKTEQFLFDDTWRPVLERLKAQFPGQNVFVTPARLKSGRAIVSVDGPRTPPTYFVMTSPTQMQLLGREVLGLDPNSLGQTTYVEYKARDGLTIPAYLTLPPGYDKAKNGPIPTVILPHGGPWARDDFGWDGSGWPQFLATRGYAVLQPQYRGSSGLSLSLWKAGDEQQWGKAMQDDKDDGAAWLVKEGIADPKKMAMFGYSYGGFAAAAAAVRPNSPYRCAIAGAPVTDLGRIGNLWGANRIQREVQGWTIGGMSPIENVDKANIPILLYHGDRDRQADTVHSRDFFRAMKSANKDVEYVEVKDMWHQLPWWPEWHRETLGLIQGYLAGPKCFGKA